MAWVRKERPLSVEEAIEQATKELAPFWFGCAPQFACLEEGDPKEVSAVPLTPEFIQKCWLFYFLDPLCYGGQGLLRVIREWTGRFQDHSLHSLLVLRPKYASYFSPEAVSRFKSQSKLDFPVVLDQDGLISKVFDVEEFPAVQLFQETVLWKKEGAQWFSGTEMQIQEFLWALDPGCPFFRPHTVASALSVDTGRIDFGKKFLHTKFGISEVSQHFKPILSEDREQIELANFGLPGKSEKLKEGEFKLFGDWILRQETLETRDPKAQIWLQMPSSKMALIAESLDPEKAARIGVEVAGSSPYDRIREKKLQSDEDGSAFARVDKADFAPVLHGVPQTDRNVVLRFPQADRCPVALYSVLFGD